MASKSNDITKSVNSGNGADASDWFGGHKTVRSDLPRFAINDPAEGEDCLKSVEGVYEDSLQETIEGKDRLVHRVLLRQPLNGQERILLWGNYHLDAVLPTLTPGTKFRATYLRKVPIKGGRTLKEITVEFPADAKMRVSPFKGIAVSVAE